MSSHHGYMWVKDIDSVSLYDLSMIGFWSCSDGVVFVVFLLDFGVVPTVWYFLLFILLYYGI